MDNHDQVSSRPGRSPVRLPLWLGFLGFLAIALSLLWGEHRVHILGALPYLLLLLCPAMHLFMHRGHGNHGPAGDQDDTRRSGDQT
jgi:hypothetical protein